jgi:large subunit ribosomal protein L13
MLVGNRFRQSLLTHTRLWYLVNAKDQVNGRLAAYIATILQGKTKPIWHPKTDVGDFVVVINTKDIAFTGRKWDRKVYRHHTGIACAVHSIDPLLYCQSVTLFTC